jgi:cyclin H
MICDATPEQRIPSYEGSTQFRNWRYSVEQLALTRATLNEAAVATIRNTFESDEVLTVDRI